jgi:hypothetical protein
MKTKQRIFCGDRDRGCGNELTSADLEAGFCTQCHEPLTVPEFPLEQALLMSLNEAESARAAQTTPLMECGCAGSALHNNAHDGLESGHPSCVVHVPAKAACNPVRPFSLEGRFAKCGPHCTVAPSNTSLAFFEYLGPGSPSSRQNCAQCGYFDSAHNKMPRSGNVCLTFRPHGPYEFDRYYCGCHGWD